MKVVRPLFAHYASYHRHGPLMLRYAGWLGAVAFPALYFLRSSQPAYDDLQLRLAGAAMCVLLLLVDRWPARLRPYYLAFSYPVLIFTLPFAFVFAALKNGGGSVAVASTLMAIFFIILMTDWRNTLIMLAVGVGAAVGVYWATDPAAAVPADYAARWPTFLLVIAGGSLFKLAGHRAAAEQMRTAYAAIAGSIAHEVRNPLGQIKQNLGRMQQALPAPGARLEDARQIDALYHALADSQLAVQRGLQLVSMTLDEVAQKPLDPAAFAYLSAAETTRKAVQEYSYEDETQRSRVSLHLVDDFVFRAEETAYLFVLFNLIKNGLYFLAAHPDVRLDVIVGGHRVVVRDNGPGVPAELLPGLFEPFRSVGKTGGTGLGLAYCRRVMQAFGGSIRCESVKGQYTEFTLQFPPVGADETRAHRDTMLATARAQLAGKRLLLVEDDAAQRLTTGYKLRPLDLAVQEAPDGRRALDLLARQDFDIVLLDLNMPVLDGYMVAQQLREGGAGRNRGAAIVAYTSEPERLARVKTQRAGMDAFISKPCDAIHLALALQRAFERRTALSRGTALAGRRVLLADDSALNRRPVAAYLTAAGAAVVEAEHGGQVLERLTEGRVDAVLLDLEMPGMGGLEAARAIRANAAWARVPLLALTAHTDQAVLGAAREAGVDGILVKPVDPERLYEALGTLLEGGAATAQHPVETPAPPLPHTGLLNLARLESYRHLGLLDELLVDYPPEMARLVQALAEAAAVRDTERVLDALHSLLGISGEAGALALYEAVRGLYVPLREEQRWPAAADWVSRIQALAGQTEAALRNYAAAPAGAANG
jgi:two-component system CAI-1 autoinducer sensor kinase/phosphatase CqsS